MNHDPTPFVMLLLAGGALIFSAVCIQQMTRNLNDAYRGVARQRSGQLQLATWLSFPRLFFPHDGRTVTVDTFTVSSGKRSRNYTRFRIAWPDRTSRCEVYPHGFFDRLGTLFGMRDIEIGSEAFDQAYVISGNEPEAIRGLLNSAVQVRIEALRRFHSPDVYVSWEGGVLTIRKLEIIRRQTELQEYIELCLNLFEAARATTGAGIQFLTEGDKIASYTDSGSLALPEDHEVACRVCGETITPDTVVFCKQCRTPHHDECWRYYGACAVYGCGCKQIAWASKKKKRGRTAG